MGKSTKTFLVLAIICTVSFFVWAGTRIVKDISFGTNCKQYLKRAADANSVEMAKEELERAISYAEFRGLTQGRVSIFLHQPKNDVGYWYENLKACYEELESLPENASALERTNVLMKLRESLTDSTNSGISVTLPEGIDIYPNNASYFWWSIFSIIGAVVFWILTFISDEGCWD